MPFTLCFPSNGNNERYCLYINKKQQKQIPHSKSNNDSNNENKSHISTYADFWPFIDCCPDTLWFPLATKTHTHRHTHTFPVQKFRQPVKADLLVYCQPLFHWYCGQNISSLAFVLVIHVVMVCVCLFLYSIHLGCCMIFMHRSYKINR